MAELGNIPMRWRDARLVRFILVGGVNTALSYGIYALGLSLGLPFTVASIIAMGCGLVISFMTQGKLVFASSLRGRFPRFVAVWAVIYLATIALIWLQTIAGISEYLAGLFAMPVTALSSFLLQRRFVFDPDR